MLKLIPVLTFIDIRDHTCISFPPSLRFTLKLILILIFIYRLIHKLEIPFKLMFTFIYAGCPKSKFPIFSPRHVRSECYENWGKYSVWDCGNTVFLVRRSAKMNEESSTMNMELSITCMSACVPCAVIQLLTAKNTSAVEIQRNEVYGSDVMSVQMVRKWSWELCEGQCEVHDELQTGCWKVVMDKSVNTNRTLLKDRRLTLQEMKTIMNDNSGNLGTQFYQSSLQKLVSRYDKCLNLFGDYLGKWCTQEE